jgi:hypothetical protein
MNAFMAKHLGLKAGATEQTDFWPMSRDELTVFDDKHPRPEDWINAEDLRAGMKKESQELLASFDLSRPADVERYRRVVEPPLDVMLGKRDEPASITSSTVGGSNGTGRFTVSAGGRALPCVVLEPTGKALNQTILWIDGRGKNALFEEGGEPTQLLSRLRDAGYRVASADVFMTGDFLSGNEPAKFPVNSGFPGYTYCYNRPLMAERIRDIVTVHDFLKNKRSSPVHLLGTGGAGPWALLAQARLRTSGEQVVADLKQFSFEAVKDVEDPNLLPGALKYGGLMGMAVLAAPSAITIFQPADDLKPLTAAYAAQGHSLTVSTAAMTDDAVLKAFADQREWDGRSQKSGGR